MITVDNLLETIKILGFVEQSADIYQKSFGDLLGCLVTVNFKDKKITYPSDLKVNMETTCNFSDPENFVVLECIVRLLDKGYRSEHIEIEKQWHLGHDPKGGRADICVYDESGKNMLLIIECKNSDQYYPHKKILEDDGGQLFSYWQQERHTKWLALYASDLKDGKVVYENNIINCSDDSNLILLAEKDDTIKLYKNAGTVEEKFEVWSETYRKIYCPENAIFGDDTVAYKIGEKPLRKKDLRDFNPEDKIVNKFEEILRHNNISDKENAFNRLVALFICKLVDEFEKKDDDVMDFQYNPRDDYETLQDRLQRLHKDGMEKFMKEEIFYIENDFVEKVFVQCNGQRREALIDAFKKKIRQLKFYTNNDFAFKDVHNEELFYQNGKVLVEVVQLFEKYRIVYPSRHQFLGDLFELLLNKGFKQNEGQFFTPMPITRFIWDSLPLDNIISNAGKYTLPKIIDYACGAGHFLTEAVEAVNAALIRHNQTDLAKDNSWVEKNIYGIEKDYRLARVAKISLFMNGAGYGNIIFGDGLDNYPEKQIESGTFDILVANPPYSVKAFKAHFKPKNNSLELLKNITNDGSEIEVLFIERIAQLLKPEGVAAVILPASILSNSSSSYVSARENLLENFKVHAIAQFGSKTFGATGTNTIVLFLEKYSEPPKRKDLVIDSVNAILSGKDLTDWEDKEILRQYLAKIEVTEDDYRKLLSKSELPDYWKDHAYFGQFVKEFYASIDVKNKQKLQSFKKWSQDKQNEWLQERFYQFVFEREQDKIKFFALIYNQRTLVVTSPAGNDEQKEFLGYDWSNRKGSEGIQIQTPGGKLYNDADRTGENTISASIREAFAEQYTPVADLGKYLAWYRLQDMIDFSMVDFDKEIKTNISVPFLISSRWKLYSLAELAKFEYGTRIVKNQTTGNKYPVYGGGGQTFTTDDYNRESRYIISRFGMSPECVRFVEGRFFLNDSGLTLQAFSEKISQKYLDTFVYIHQNIVYSFGRGSGQKNIDIDSFKQMRIPLPPLEVQQQIVSECEKVDVECKKANTGIENAQKQIIQIFKEAQLQAHNKYRLGDSVIFEVCIGQRILNKELVSSGTVPVYSANVHEPFGYVNDSILKDFSRASVLWGIDGDWMTNYIPENVAFNPTDHCGVIRVLLDDISAKYLSFVLHEAGKEMRFSRTLRASTDRIKGITIELPSIQIQNEVIAKIEKFEQQIEAAQKILDSAFARKQAILDKYLQ